MVLTGAGASAESGVPTFRSNGGLWKSHRFQDLATPEAFAANPALVWEFYQWRQQGVRDAEPNRGHHVLVEMEEALGDRFLIVTQNVDDLHERAGSKRVMHMHGEILKARCVQCAEIHPDYDFTNGPDGACRKCGALALRPHIVWFGEMPFYLNEIQAALERAEAFMTVGSSGVVYPAAQFVHIAKGHGATTVLVNLDEPDNRSGFDLILQGQSGEILDALWREIEGDDPVEALVYKAQAG